MRTLLLTPLLLAALLLLGGCEDDPILTPTPSKPDGGSYSRTSLPPGANDSLPHARSPRLRYNPERF